MASREDGYTLTEMLVVVAIIGLLAAALTPVLVGQLDRARAKSARLQVQNVATTVESFRSDVGRYPTAAEGLAALITQPDAAEGWLGPYVRRTEDLQDPWGRPLVYRLPAGSDEPQVISLGRDGKDGGRGLAADVAAP